MCCPLTDQELPSISGFSFKRSIPRRSQPLQYFEYKNKCGRFLDGYSIYYICSDLFWIADFAFIFNDYAVNSVTA